MRIEQKNWSIMSKNLIGLHKYELDTPCLIIDLDALQFNLLTMQQHASQHNIHVRPHCKTHKCSKLAALQMKLGAIGLCTTKISEAAVLIQKGLSSVLITSPVVTPYKIAAFTELALLAPDTLIVTDNTQNAFDLNEAGQKIKQKINVLVDVDAGIGRTGVAAERALELGFNIQQSPWLKFMGIQCYAGNLQHIHAYEERKLKSLAVMSMAGKLALEFKKQGLPCPIVTGTGTGTYDIDYLVPEVTEIQPGSYTVMDVEYAGIGSKETPAAFGNFKPAMTLLTTVISHNRPEHVTVDAGTKSIYVDGSNKPKIINRHQLVYDWAGFGDEHGKITALPGGTLPQNGDVLELIVPHCDPTINLHDKFHIIQNGHVVDTWEIDMRGKSQ